MKRIPQNVYLGTWIVILLTLMLARPGQILLVCSKIVIPMEIALLSIMAYLKMLLQKMLSPQVFLKNISIACGGDYRT